MTPEAGITLPGVPDPAIEHRRTQARHLQQQGLSYTQIARQLGATFDTVKEDLRPTPKPAPLSIRLPADLDAAVKDTATGEGIPTSRVVVRALRHWFKDRERTEKWNAHKRERRAAGEKGL